MAYSRKLYKRAVPDSSSEPTTTDATTTPKHPHFHEPGHRIITGTYLF